MAQSTVESRVLTLWRAWGVTPSQVVLAPYGDASTEDGERQSVAVVTNQETEELITSSAFSSVVSGP